MAEYKYALSLTSQFYFCGIPFRLDTTPKCSLNCLYCFAMARGGRQTSTSLITNPESISRTINRSFHAEETNQGLNNELLRHRLPVHFGGMSDPFANTRTSKVSKKLLRSLTTHDAPILLSTKNTKELTKDETLEELDRAKHLAIQVSLSTSDNHLASQIEPGTPSPEERLGAIKQLSQMGIHVIVRLQPLLPPIMDQVKDELIPAVAEAGAKHVIVEFLKLPVEKGNSLVKELNKALEWDSYGYFEEKGAQLVGREWLLPVKYKWEQLGPIIVQIRTHGMTYGAGDYGLNHIGDTACCCGIDELEGFKNWFQGNLANIIRQAPEGDILLPDRNTYWYPKRSIRRILNSNSRLPDTSAVYDYLVNKWNRPGTVNAPDEYLGIEWLGEFDNNNNCVYTKKSLC